METFEVGDIIVSNFPFTDLSSSKKRPSLIIANFMGEDYLLCQITGLLRKDDYSILLKNSEVIKGNLAGDSYIRTNKLFTASQDIIKYKIRPINKIKINEVKQKIISNLGN